MFCRLSFISGQGFKQTVNDKVVISKGDLTEEEFVESVAS